MNMLNISKKVELLLASGKKLITAESCTAGLISSTVAETPGSSSWLEGGFVVYTPQAKNKFLNVSLESIEKFNITSEQVAFEMAYGAIEKSVDANVSIAVTGVAGPSGGTEEIPVGTVCIAWARVYGEDIQVMTEKCFFEGSRNEIREKVVNYSLSKLIELLN
jgi:PncC family amidohydrolase